MRKLSIIANRMLCIILFSFIFLIGCGKEKYCEPVIPAIDQIYKDFVSIYQFNQTEYNKRLAYITAEFQKNSAYYLALTIYNNDVTRITRENNERIDKIKSEYKDRINKSDWECTKNPVTKNIRSEIQAHKEKMCAEIDKFK